VENRCLKIILKNYDTLGYLRFDLFDTLLPSVILDSLIIDNVSLYYTSNYVSLRKANNLEIVCEARRRIGSGVSLVEYIYLSEYNDKIIYQTIPKEYSYDVLNTQPIERNSWSFKWKWKENTLILKSVQRDKNLEYSLEIPLKFSEDNMKYEIDTFKVNKFFNLNEVNYLMKDEALLDYFKMPNKDK
jgi:hypothetical protein